MIGQGKGKPKKPTVLRNDTKLVINIMAHNGFKADYPIFEKALLESKLFTLTSQCASGMAKISYSFEMVCETTNVVINFTDSMNLF